MAEIISYPVNTTVLETDLLLGTHVPQPSGSKPTSTKNFTISSIVSLAQAGMPDSRPYKVYTAVISQFGTDAPVSIVSENTLGFNLTWARLNEGLLQYKLSAPNPTDINSDKAWVSIGYGSNGGGVPVFLTYTGIFDSVFSFNPFLLNGTRADLQTNGRVPIEIRVYN
jgi:hypothetical protein